MIPHQDSTRLLLALSQFLEAAITYFSSFFFHSPRESSSLSKSRGAQANDLDNRP